MGTFLAVLLALMLYALFTALVLLRVVYTRMYSDGNCGSETSNCRSAQPQEPFGQALEDDTACADVSSDEFREPLECLSVPLQSLDGPDDVLSMPIDDQDAPRTPDGAYSITEGGRSRAPRKMPQRGPGTSIWFVTLASKVQI